MKLILQGANIPAMTALAIAIIGLICRADKKPAFFAWNSLSILTVYVFTLSTLYILR